MNDQAKHIEDLIAKAAKAEDPRDAVGFSQAACNAANALRCLQDYKTLVT